MKIHSVALILVGLVYSSFSMGDINDSHPVVPGFERFAKVDEISDSERGRFLLNELNCASCHAGTIGWSLAPKQAPILTNVGQRILPEYLESFLLDPHQVKPGTTMPNVLAGKSDDEKQRIAESLSHFLASTGTAVRQNSSNSFVTRGEKLFHEIGCVACHNPQNEEVLIATSVPMGKLSSKYSLASLTEFIKDPLHVRPSGRMPQFNLDGAQAQSIAAYLLRDVVIDSKINFAYYEGAWDNLPNFDELPAVSSGTTADFDVHLGRPDQFGIVFSGFWETYEPAVYEFRLTSDDGSRLVIDRNQVVENNGVHPMQTRAEKIQLPAGIHEVRIEYFENQGGEDLRAEVVGGGLEGIDLASLLRNTREKPQTPGVKEFVLDLQKAATGKQWFVSIGCANCHEMNIDGQQLASTSARQKQFSDLDTKAGCLGRSSNAGPAPDFSLSDQQQKSIAAALENIETAKPTAPDLTQSVHEKLLTFNCYACHIRESANGSIRGGVIDTTGESQEVFGRKKWFTGTQTEMGDEGQHPPYLKSVGAKFKPQWLRHVLEQGPKARPYMLTQMPKFGIQNLENLPEQLMELDRLTDVVKVIQTESEREVKKHGRFFAGAESLACIKCHTFNNYPATGIQAMDLATMARRLDKDWFHAYMLKPSRFRRGTRMPESWPGGQTFYKDILDGDVDKQVDALWAYLEDGENAAKPKGLLKSKQELVVGDTPLIYRNFILGAGPRAIAVGYPEFVNLAFDAENCRLALIWQENFIDASRHWTGRGEGFEPPLGEHVFAFADGPGFAFLDNEKTKWPVVPARELDTHFLGYRFDPERRPTFRYRVGEIEITDQPIPRMVADRPMLSRRLTVSSTQPGLIWFRLTAAAKIDSAQENTFIIDDRLKVTLSGAVKALVRPSGSQQELVVPIEMKAGSVNFEIRYDW